MQSRLWNVQPSLNGRCQPLGRRFESSSGKVAIGVQVGLFLTDRPSELIDEVYGFCESVGLPTTLSDIGIGDASDEELQLVAKAACAEGETIHHEACPISPDAVFAALKTADQVGRSRRDS
jgi:glycerol dehydrogenase